MTSQYSITTKLWLWHSDKALASWHFLSIGGEVGDAIKADAIIARLELGLPKKRGWGAVKVRAAIGETCWQTSIFPGTGEDIYLLPVKAAVRQAEGIIAGDMVTVVVNLP